MEYMPAAFSLQVMDKEMKPRLHEAAWHDEQHDQAAGPTVQEPAADCKWQALARGMIAGHALGCDL